MVPDSIDRYKIISEIGRGGMATVFHAYDPRFERDVAIKIIPNTMIHDDNFRIRFEREAKTIASLEHPTIVPVYDFNEEDGCPYIVMRYMSGGSLSKRLSSGPIPPQEASQIINRLAQALDAAHQKSIVHRDLKPGNILFDQYGNAFLSDFGIARIFHQQEPEITAEAITGTPEYMSPEQIRGDTEINGCSDVYSLGIILYQMLTGKTPYHANTPAKTLIMHLLEPIPRLTRTGLPSGCRQIISRAIAKDSHARFPSASALSSAFNEILKNHNPDQSLTPLTGDSSKVDANPAPASLAKSQTEFPHPTDQLPSKRRVPSLSLIPLWISLAIFAVVITAGFFLQRDNGFIFPLGSSESTPTMTEDLAGSLLEDLPFTGNPGSISSEMDESPLITSPENPEPAFTELASPTDFPMITHQPYPPQPASTSAGPIIGGADKIAFVNSNYIWVANLDGSSLEQITNDGGIKIDLQWAKDGESITYIQGKCVQSTQINRTEVQILACFETAESLDAFEVSPDGGTVAISLNRELYIVPYDLEKLQQARTKADLQALANCPFLAPYERNSVKSVRWSNDKSQLALVVQGFSNEKQVDLVRLIDISECDESFPRLDEFPAERFTMPEYETNPIIQTLTWDGELLLSLTSFKRNDGFGHLWVYNADLHKAEQIDPIHGICCYRDPNWSPDGRHFLFAFQEIRFGPRNVILLYLIPYGTVGTGIKYEPIPLPEGFFPDPREKPQAILRPAK